MVVKLTRINGGSHVGASLLTTLGKILGVGGSALGVFFLLFRELIRKSIFPKLKKEDAYRLLRLIVVSISLVAVVGIAAWILGDRIGVARSVVTTGDQSPVIQDAKGDVHLEFNALQAPK
jgi:hypothetical protein